MVMPSVSTPLQRFLSDAANEMASAAAHCVTPDSPWDTKNDNKRKKETNLRLQTVRLRHPHELFHHAVAF
jgi:hypothetical protein